MNTSPRRAGIALTLVGVTLTGCSAGDPVAASPTGPATPPPTTSEPSTAEQPVTLEMAFVGRLADEQIGHFQEQVASRSGGALTMAVDPALTVDVVTIEQDIVTALRSGDLDVGVVGVRAFRELGIRDFDALVAPMAIDSMAAQAAVLDSDLPDRMLAGLEAHDLTGLAVIAGPMRRPTATEPITTLADFDGLPFHTFHGEINALSVEALGGTHVDKNAEGRNADIEAGTLTAYENTLAFFDHAIDWRTKVHTANLNLWPAVSVLLMSSSTWEALTDTQRTALQEAASDTAQASSSLLPDEAELAQRVCAAGARLATATPEGLAEIEAALAPVYAELRTDPLVAGYLDEIEALTAGLPPESPAIPPGCQA